MRLMETIVEIQASVTKGQIPFEVVDDDEFEAIEAALQHASSVPRILPHANSYPPSLRHRVTQSQQPKRSIAESCNSWLAQCSNHRQARSFDDKQIGSVLLLKSGQSAFSTTVSCASLSKSSDSLVFKYTAVQGETTQGCSCDKENKSHDGLSLKKCSCVPYSHSACKNIRSTEGAATPRADDVQVIQGATVPAVADIEDVQGNKKDGAKSQMGDGSALPSEPKPRCLSVTDFTALEWCEKQVEFTKTLGKPKQTEAMKAGSARHAELEVEVLKKVEVEITSKEDSWAMRLINFITGARQMLSEGMTRELPVVGLIEGAWVIGIIDELKMRELEGVHRPQLIDTKTRNRPTPPSAPQKQNGRMQLMVYKCLWDNLVTMGVPFDYFFEHFRLRPEHLLSSDIRVHAAEVFPDAEVENLRDVSRMYSQECILFPESHELLLLRYEWQADRSLLGQDEFYIEREWLDLRIGWHLEFWHGLREPAYVPEDETWKCRYCAFAELCPAVQALSLGTEPKKVHQNSSIQGNQELKEVEQSPQIQTCLESKHVEESPAMQRNVEPRPVAPLAQAFPDLKQVEERPIMQRNLDPRQFAPPVQTCPDLKQVEERPVMQRNLDPRQVAPLVQVDQVPQIQISEEPRQVDRTPPLQMPQKPKQVGGSTPTQNIEEPRQVFSINREIIDLTMEPEEPEQVHRRPLKPNPLKRIVSSGILKYFKKETPK